MSAEWSERGALRYRRRGESTMEFIWVAKALGLALKNLKQDDGHTYADLHAFQGKTRLLVRPRANVTSDRSIPGLAKSLAGAAGTEVEWRTFLDSIVAILVDELDQKGTVTWLQPLPRQQLAQPMLFADFVPLGLLSGLVAHGGTGKSITGLLMMLAVTTGVQVGPFRPLRQGVCLYADWENQWELHARRLTRICDGLDVEFPLGRIIHYQPRGRLVNAEAELVDLAIENNVILTVFDSIAFAAGGNLNDAETATTAVNVLKHIPGTKIMIAHVSKAAVENGAKGPSNSVFFWNGPQAVYDLSATEPDPEGAIVLTISQSKANVGARLRRPLGVRVSFEDDDQGGPIRPLEYRVQGHLLGGETMSERQRILDLLESRNGEPIAAETMAEILYEQPDKARVDSVRTVLRRLRVQGVVDLQEGPKKAILWALVQPGGQEPSAVQDDERCGICRATPIVAYSEFGDPRCVKHKPEGAW